MNWKKLLAALLAVCLAVSCLCTNAVAAEEKPDGPNDQSLDYFTGDPTERPGGSNNQDGADGNNQDDNDDGTGGDSGGGSGSTGGGSDDSTDSDPDSSIGGGVTDTDGNTTTPPHHPHPRRYYHRSPRRNCPSKIRRQMGRGVHHLRKMRQA